MPRSPQRLVLTTGTVGNHVEHILRRLGMSNRASGGALLDDPAGGTSRRGRVSGSVAVRGRGASEEDRRLADQLGARDRRDPGRIDLRQDLVDVERHHVRALPGCRGSRTGRPSRCPAARVCRSRAPLTGPARRCRRSGRSGGRRWLRGARRAATTSGDCQQAAFERCHSSRVPERIPSMTKSPKPPSSSPRRQAQVPCATLRPSSSSARSRWASSEMMTASGYCSLDGPPDRQRDGVLAADDDRACGRAPVREHGLRDVSESGSISASAAPSAGRPGRGRPGRPGRRRTGRRRGAGCSSRCCARPGGRRAAPARSRGGPEPVRSSGAPNRKKRDIARGAPPGRYPRMRASGRRRPAAASRAPSTSGGSGLAG